MLQGHTFQVKISRQKIGRLFLLPYSFLFAAMVMMMFGISFALGLSHDWVVQVGFEQRWTAVQRIHLCLLQLGGTRPSSLTATLRRADDNLQTTPACKAFLGSLRRTWTLVRLQELLDVDKTRPLLDPIVPPLLQLTLPEPLYPTIDHLSEGLLPLPDHLGS